MSKKITTKEDVFKAAMTNHIWVDAMSLVRPTPELYQHIGKQIVAMLKDKDLLLPNFNEQINDETLDNKTRKTLQELSELTPMLYLSINKS